MDLGVDVGQESVAEKRSLFTLNPLFDSLKFQFAKKNARETLLRCSKRQLVKNKSITADDDHQFAIAFSIHLRRLVGLFARTINCIDDVE